MKNGKFSKSKEYIVEQTNEMFDKLELSSEELIKGKKLYKERKEPPVNLEDCVNKNSIDKLKNEPGFAKFKSKGPMTKLSLKQPCAGNDQCFCRDAERKSRAIITCVSCFCVFHVKCMVSNGMLKKAFNKAKRFTIEFRCANCEGRKEDNVPKKMWTEELQKKLQIWKKKRKTLMKMMKTTLLLLLMMTSIKYLTLIIVIVEVKEKERAFRKRDGI